MFSLVSWFSSPVSQIGWEVFYQAILIPTRLMELTSKRECNCYIMITGLVDYGLHVIYLRDLNPLLAYK